MPRGVSALFRKGIAADVRGDDAVNAKFPPERRLRRPGEFKHVYATGRRFGNELFTVSVAPSESGPRLGLSIAARILRHAVARNRVRRVVRESFRLQVLQLPPLDIVIGARAAVTEADNAHLRAALERLWRKIITAGP